MLRVMRKTRALFLSLRVRSPLDRKLRSYQFDPIISARMLPFTLLLTYILTSQQYMRHFYVYHSALCHFILLFILFIILLQSKEKRKLFNHLFPLFIICLFFFFFIFIYIFVYIFFLFYHFMYVYMRLRGISQRAL